MLIYNISFYRATVTKEQSEKLQDVIMQIEQLHRERGKSKVPAHRRLLEVSAPAKKFPKYHRTGRKTSAEKIFLRISKPVPAGI